MTDEHRKQKLNGKQIRDLGVAWPYLVIPTHLTTLKPLCRYLHTVIHDFFLLQFNVKFGFKKIEVIPVDHPLDDEIPFDPEKSDTYLDFIHFWIRPLTLIIKRFGVKRALPHCARFMQALYQAYREAARMYKFRMSTTARPPAGDNKNLKTIHLLDPHFLCVPSLHISVVILTFSFFADVFNRERLPEDEARRYNEELYRGAVEIAETVLYLKQHSVNCIPAAVYMMIHLQPALFSIEQATAFIDTLFNGADDVSAAAKKRITEHIHYMLDRLILEGCAEDDWLVPVQRWILQYQKQTAAGRSE
ncbi:hypothetical protein [Treponema brennaborense]|uniref:Uncharacterized protein n=1 Tax=Treponema brennaborense (strain DSM 12168 / CIP 105900 / DD5/3) TaxID=906968 RepID=F4LPS9_TREBD|nr:hypothetical protein [Treponema brennaborense]AEE16021.1 hypothetical protein Trebr_0578 [Treponema brennaborense DSM 12168]